MTDADLLALHRAMVAVPSESGREADLCGFVFGYLRKRGAEARRVGDSVWAETGDGPTLCLNSHLDTVPAVPGWTRQPHAPIVEGGRVYGLGSNDAKASAAAMVAAFLRLRARVQRLRARVVLALASEEETTGQGTESLLADLARNGAAPDAVVVGEPTGLDVAVAQKGLMVLELRAGGQACHAANARALGAANALRGLASDLVALDGVDLGPPHPDLGPVTVEPTLASGGTARNVVPALATCVLDVRTNPDPPPAEVLARLRSAVKGELRVLSDRLGPRQVDQGDRLVVAALAARPEARLFGSRTMSDLTFFTGIPGIKVGPGSTRRSHAPDEYVLESEVLEGARFYERLFSTWSDAAPTPPWRPS